MQVVDSAAEIVPWLLALHISALALWCATLLYLPTLISSSGGRDRQEESPFAETPHRNSVMRFTFTVVATPAALLAITAGTAIFLLDRTLELWLLFKLTLVLVMVIGHMFTGLLIIRAEELSPRENLLQPCRALTIVQVLLILGVFTLVLAKPFQPLS